MPPLPDRLRALAKRTAPDLAALAGLVAFGYLYLSPASGALLRGDATVMVGDDSDSITNPWQYTLVLQTLAREPSLLLYGGIWSDQFSAPDGVPIFIPFVERLLVLVFAPFLRPDLMPTAMVWALMVLSGASLYALGRVLGWSRVVAFALALAWAFNPFTRARAIVHIALVGLYWAPLALLALHLLARPPSWLAERPRARIALPALALLGVAFAAHYYIIMGAALTPLFVAFYVLMVPSRAELPRAFARLAGAALPAILFTAVCLAVPVPASRAAPAVSSPPETTTLFLQLYGAEPVDYVAGDVAFGSRDLLPPRARLTEAVRSSVFGNWHERANGIRWSILAAAALTLAALGVPRVRRSLDGRERRVLAFAAAFGLSSFLLAFSPGRLRVFGHDVSPVGFVNRVLPRYRVPNRIATMVHLSALLATGVGLTLLARRRRRAGELAAFAAPVVVLLDYAPLHPVPLSRIAPVREELAALGDDCGAGLVVPYVTWGFPGVDWYRLGAEIRGTSCRIVHARYLTPTDDVLRETIGAPDLDEAERARIRELATCTNARFLFFRPTAVREARESLCRDLGWPFLSEDVCRAPVPPGEPRSVEGCTPPRPTP